MRITPTALILPLAHVALIVACGPADHTERVMAPRAPVAADRTAAAGENGGPRFGEWSPPVNLGTVVNTVAVETDPSISRNGLTLYFVGGNTRVDQDGKRGKGGRDIWVTRRASLDDPWGPPVNLGGAINSSAHEDKPTISRDGRSLYFASTRMRDDGRTDFDLYVSRWRNAGDNSGWGTPVNLGDPVNSPASEHSGVTFLEDDATGVVTLYFASDREGSFDIYSSAQRPDGSFGPVVRESQLSSNGSIERDPAIRRDGLEMFFASNRPGTYGNQDLWVATRASTADDWSKPVNLGPMINSPRREPADDPKIEQSNDWGPALSFDGTTLYYAAALRPGNAGERFFDIWVTTREKLTGPNPQ